VRIALVLLALAACEHTNKAPPPKPPPPKSDPVKQARDEFELISGSPVGAHLVVGLRGALVPTPDDAQTYDGGDFIGRLRTLFGPREHDEYLLRHKSTGCVVIAEFGLDQYAQYAIDGRGQVQKDDPKLRGVVERLETLVEAVPPADWEKTIVFVDHAYRIGAKGGHSFKIEVSPSEAFEVLAKDAESPDPQAVRPDRHVVQYFLAHQDVLARQRGRVLAAYNRLVAAAKTDKGDDRDLMLEEARKLAGKLHVPPP
jgi:hypothetical protein